MIEFYGWASFWATLNQDDDQEDKDLEQIVKDFNVFVAHFDKTNNSNTTVIFKPQNGKHQLSIMGCANHKSVTWQEVLRIFDWLASNASGSYGKLYLQDDEDLEFETQFQVYVLQNGSLIKTADEFFKPALLNF